MSDLDNKVDPTVAELEYNFKYAHPHVRNYALSAAEEKLKQQATLMLAGDRRAFTLAALGSAIATFSGGFLADRAFSSEGINLALSIASITVLSLAIIGAVFCAWSARPGQIVYFPGWKPEFLKEDAEKKPTQEEFTASLIAWTNWRISENENIMKTSVRLSFFGGLLIFVAPIIGFCSYFVTIILQSCIFG